MSRIRMFTTPDHIVFYYELDAGSTQISGYKLDINQLAFRLTGRVRSVVDDPNNLINTNERQLEVDAPSAHRASHGDAKVTVKAISASTLLCIIPKTQIDKIMGPRLIQKVLDANTYEVITDTNAR